MKLHLDRTKDKAWVTDTVHGTRVLFSEVEPLSRKVASALTRGGFRKGELLYFVTNDMALLDLFILGAWRCNGAVKGGCTATTEDEQCELMKKCEAKFAVCDKNTAEHVKNVVRRIPWKVQLFSIGQVEGATTLEYILEDDGKGFPKELHINPIEDGIFIPSTGGSTGNPKGALLTHYALINAAHNGRYMIRNTDFMFTFSNFHIAGLIFTLHQLIAGYTTYTIPTFAGKKVLEAISKYKPKSFGTFPNVLMWLTKNEIPPEYDMSSLQYIFTGGASVDRYIIDTLNNKFPNLKQVDVAYGATEFLLVSCTAAASMFNIPQAPDSGMQSSGILFPFVKIKIADVDTGKALGRGQQGEIRVKNPSVMKGYMKKPEETRESFDEDGWFRTGDIGYFDDNGHLYIVDRLKETFKYQAQEHISPSELEGLLQTHPAVMAAGVVGVPDPECTALPRAYVVKKPGHDITEQQLKKYVADRTPDYKHLRGGVIFVEELPLSGAGKLSRPTLRKWINQ